MLYNFLLTFIRFIFRLINGREVVQGLENLPKDQPYIIAATHRSLTDPLFVAFETYPHQIAFMAKESLFKFKPLGWLFRKVNVFPVNRGKPSTSTIKHAVKIMNEDGKILGIFPSGSRHTTEIKGGTAFIQKLSKQAIVPCAIQPPIGFKQFFLRRRCKIAFGAPIPYQEGVKYDKDKLAQIDAQLAEEFAKLDHQLDPNYHYQPRKK